jgi:hypothetical protein
MENKTAVAQFEVLSQNLPRWTDVRIDTPADYMSEPSCKKLKKKLLPQSLSRLRYEPSTSRMQIRSVIV